MKLYGGEWSKGDLIALVSLIVTIVGVVIAYKTLPSSSTNNAPNSQSVVTQRPPVRIPRTGSATSGQVNFGCEQTLNVETPAISLGNAPKDILAQASWENTDNVKTQTQVVQNVEEPATHRPGIKAVGTITGLDTQNLVVTKNCPGGGHGTLTLHATWTEEK